MFKKLIEWFTRPQITEIEYYISKHDPKTPADVDMLINEFNYQWVHVSFVKNNCRNMALKSVIENGRTRYYPV